MTTTIFDSLGYFEKLKEAGVPEAQARVQYDLLKWQLAGWLALAAIMAKGFGWLGF